MTYNVSSGTLNRTRCILYYTILYIHRIKTLLLRKCVMAVLTAWVECGIHDRRRTVYRSLQQTRQGNQYSAVAVKFW